MAFAPLLRRADGTGVGKNTKSINHKEHKEHKDGERSAISVFFAVKILFSAVFSSQRLS
jgi:hypothetical protein